MRYVFTPTCGTQFRAEAFVAHKAVKRATVGLVHIAIQYKLCLIVE